VHACAVDGICAVAHEEFQVGLSRGLQTIAQRGEISIKAATNVLNIEHERVEVPQLFQLRRAARAVKTVNWQAGLFVHAVADVLVERAANAVLRAEQEDRKSTRLNSSH